MVWGKTLSSIQIVGITLNVGVMNAVCPKETFVFWVKLGKVHKVVGQIKVGFVYNILFREKQMCKDDEK